MIHSIKLFLMVTLPLSIICNAYSDMAKVDGGKFIPLYGQKDKHVVIEDFYMDVNPVTHKEYLAFVKRNPQWQKSKVLKLLADGSYLVLWRGDEILSSDIPDNSPVNSVSWFAAMEYCKEQGKRLPTVDEWEYAAMASEHVRDARRDSIYNQRILEGYELPKTYMKKIGSTVKNYWGLQDLHGIVWEWTLDFNSVLISGESRGDNDTDRNLFCASGAVGANDLMNYAAFMRYALRGSLKANYTVKSLGFRCASDNSGD